MVQYTPKTGEVWIRNFDRGVVEHLQPTIINNDYYVNFSSGLSPNTNENVKIVFNKPEMVLNYIEYPIIHIQRESYTPNLERWHSYGQLEYKQGVPGTEIPGTNPVRYSEIEMQQQAWPYDMNYTIACYSRYEYEAQTLLKWILRLYRPRGYIKVIDSLSEDRFYTFFSDPAIQDLGEIVDVANRVKAYAISVLVEGELDLTDPMTTGVVQDVEINSERI